MLLVSHWQVGATTVTDMWVTMAYLQFSRILMAWFKLSLFSKAKVELENYSRLYA
jgi:hypothetical protein